MDPSDFPAAMLYAAATTLGSASVVAVCTVILSRSSLFRPVRAWLAERKGTFWQWLSKLISCTFCTSIWLSMGVWQFNHILHGFWWMFNPLTIATTAAPMIWLIYNSHSNAGEP